MLPGSLVGRVFALYTVTLLGFVLGGLGLFYYYQLNVVLEDEQLRGDALGSIIAPIISDSVVIGDYDTVRQALSRTVDHSVLKAASFIDRNGGVVKALSPPPSSTEPPEWLMNAVDSKLYDVNVPINVGGQDYGVLRLNFDARDIAGRLWSQIRLALLLGGLGIGGGLMLILFPLVRWLGGLNRVQAFEKAMTSGEVSAEILVADQAPTEFRQTFEVLGRAAAHLQSQRHQAAVTLGAIADAVLTLDAQGVVILANPAACELLGLEPEQVQGQLASRLMPQVIPATITLQAWRGRRRTVRNSAGHELVIDTTLSAILSPEGDTVGYVLACRDMSEQHELDMRLRAELKSRASALISMRKVLEEFTQDIATPVPHASDDLEAISGMISTLVQKLQARGEQLTAIFELSPDGFVSFDAERRANYVSPAFTQLTGLSVEQLIGQPEAQVERLLHQQANSATRWRSFESILRDLPTDGAADAPRRTIIELARPARRILQLGLRESQSSVISQVLSLRDVTHETEVDQMKSEFLSTAAHELRTPMTSIYGFSELLQFPKLKPEQREDLVKTIHRQSELMISIINELLDLARIEARRGKDFEIETLDLVHLAESLLHDFNPPKQRPPPEFDRGPGMALVQVDRKKMAQAIGNVLSNAYKYSPQGGAVQVRIVSDQRDGHAIVGFEIRDQGIGMTPEQLSRVSERFYRADTSGTIPGTGLGMSIVKEIMELQGGQLHIDSEHGVGSVVTLWLPEVTPSSEHSGWQNLT
ncbi:ATP-binding protein [Curvibacter sp. RS43]|uniref:PAS domain-containing sensor histidine kinase n=1 Tax=Curvibacter microcysteis TaxID=3026419 RepID=UPI00235FE837|nr:ATP-binding protein [Curvibacter sp. RS43]MDD0810499.1 ATP-binding protein [Curvibacter sp. RS43]